MYKEFVLKRIHFELVYDFCNRLCFCKCGYYGIPKDLALDCEFINPKKSLRLQIQFQIPLSKESFNRLKYKLEYDFVFLINELQTGFIVTGNYLNNILPGSLKVTWFSYR